jgi:hypothetical protein
VDFQAVNFFAPPEQQGGFQAGNMPVQSVAQPIRGGAGRDAMEDLKYYSALRRSHIGKYEDWKSAIKPTNLKEKHFEEIQIASIP